MRFIGAVSIALLGASADAGIKTLAIAAGDCRSPELSSAMGQFHQALRDRITTDLYEPELVLDIIRPRPTKSLDDLQRQVESARTLHYSGQGERAVELTKQALADLERVSPLVAPWAVTTEALLVQALAYRGLNRKAEHLDSLRRIARIDPSLTLDPNFFTPSFIQSFEGVKKELTRGRRFTLQIQSQPSGAAVFVDGKRLGETPFRETLSTGDYQVELVNGSAVSFTRNVRLARDEQVVVDIAYEGALATELPLCMAFESEADAKLGASKLAASIGAERTVVMRLVSKPAEPPYFRAILVQGADEERSGNVRRGSLAELADFIITGKALPPLTVEPQRARPAGPTAQTLPPAETQPLPELSSAPLTTGVSSSAKPLGPWRVAGFIGLGLGAALGGVGAGIYASGSDDRQRVADVAGQKLADPSATLGAAARAQNVRIVSFSLIGAGVGLGVAGALLALLAPSPANPVISMLPLEQGALFSLTAGWR